jgi:hypothetical protein
MSLPFQIERARIIRVTPVYPVYPYLGGPSSPVPEKPATPELALNCQESGMDVTQPSEIGRGATFRR